jgi:hypothetical protein
VAPPFCWQSKAALKLIKKAFGETHGVCHALAVYLVLTRFASDEGADSFTREKSDIADAAGVSVRKCHDVLGRFSEFGLLQIQRNHFPGTSLKAPSTYTLLAVAHGELPIGTPCTSIGMGAEQGNLPISEEELQKNPSNVALLPPESACANKGGKKGSPPPLDAIAQGHGELRLPPQKSQPWPMQPSEKDRLIRAIDKKLETIRESSPGTKYRSNDGTLKPEVLKYRSELRKKRRELETSWIGVEDPTEGEEPGPPKPKANDRNAGTKNEPRKGQYEVAAQRTTS